MRARLFTITALLAAATIAAQTPEKVLGPNGWKVDVAHSRVGFEVTHMVVSNVEGNFKEFDAEITFDPASIETASASATIQVASISTDNETRDKHLRTSDFFDVEHHPTITFVSKKVVKIDDKKFTMTGDLTMRGVTKEVTLDGKLNGIIDDPWGNRRAGVSLSATVDRLAFGISWNNALETGGVVVSNEVELDIELELVQPKAEG